MIYQRLGLQFVLRRTGAQCGGADTPDEPLERTSQIATRYSSQSKRPTEHQVDGQMVYPFIRPILQYVNGA